MTAEAIKKFGTGIAACKALDINYRRFDQSVVSHALVSPDYRAYSPPIKHRKYGTDRQVSLAGCPTTNGAGNVMVIVTNGRSRKRGRPTKDVSLTEAEKLAARGLSYDQIAVCLQMSTKALGYRRKDVPGLQGAIDRGRTAGVKAVTNALYESAVEGNLGAQVFYLKNRDRDNWKDRFDYKVKTDLGQLHLEAME